MRASPRFIRYILVAGVAYVVDLGGYCILVNFGILPVYANALIKVLAAIVGFFMHRTYTYEMRFTSGVWSHAFKYFGLAFLYTPISSAVLYVILIILPSEVVAKIIADILLFVFTYIVTSGLVFTRKVEEA